MLPLSDDYNLIVRQEPERAKVAGPKEKGMFIPEQRMLPSRLTKTSRSRPDRKPIDPPPILQLQIRDFSDPAQ